MTSRILIHTSSPRYTSTKSVSSHWNSSLRVPFLCLQPMAYFCVHDRAISSQRDLCVLYMCAISGTRGSSGLGSVSRDEIERSTLDMVRAGLHWSFRISRQMLPFELMFGWYTCTSATNLSAKRKLVAKGRCNPPPLMVFQEANSAHIKVAGLLGYGMTPLYSSQRVQKIQRKIIDLKRPTVQSIVIVQYVSWWISFPDLYNIHQICLLEVQLKSQPKWRFT